MTHLVLTGGNAPPFQLYQSRVMLLYYGSLKLLDGLHTILPY